MSNDNLSQEARTALLNLRDSLESSGVVPTNTPPATSEFSSTAAERYSCAADVIDALQEDSTVVGLDESFYANSAGDYNASGYTVENLMRLQSLLTKVANGEALRPGEFKELVDRVTIAKQTALRTVKEQRCELTVKAADVNLTEDDALAILHHAACDPTIALSLVERFPQNKKILDLGTDVAGRQSMEQLTHTLQNPDKMTNDDAAALEVVRLTAELSARRELQDAMQAQLDTMLSQVAKLSSKSTTDQMLWATVQSQSEQIGALTQAVKRQSEENAKLIAALTKPKVAKKRDPGPISNLAKAAVGKLRQMFSAVKKTPELFRRYSGQIAAQTKQTLDSLTYVVTEVTPAVAKTIKDTTYAAAVEAKVEVFTELGALKETAREATARQIHRGTAVGKNAVETSRNAVGSRLIRLGSKVSGKEQTVEQGR